MREGGHENIFNGYLEKKSKKNMSAVNSAFFGGGEETQHYWRFILELLEKVLHYCIVGTFPNEHTLFLQ